MRVEISQRHQANLESGMSLEEEEARVSQTIEDYLKNHYEELAGKVDYWMTRHEQDLDMKMKDLHELKVRCQSSNSSAIILALENFRGSISLRTCGLLMLSSQNFTECTQAYYY